MFNMFVSVVITVMFGLISSCFILSFLMFSCFSYCFVFLWQYKEIFAHFFCDLECAHLVIHSPKDMFKFLKPSKIYFSYFCTQK